MNRVALIDVVALTARHLPDTPRIARVGHAVPLRPVAPAVTCSVQATYLTGTWPERHGIVGNGWYFREEGEVRLWRQSNRLVQAPKLWDLGRAMDPSFTCANLFWWFNMFSGADVAVTPRPMYPADGRKLPDIYTRPAGLREELQRDLGRFPLFHFWGPTASIRSSRWIAEAAKRVEERFAPTVSLVYLPHLDYNLQRLGPDHPDVVQDLRALDDVCGDLVDFYAARGVQAMVVSEYAMNQVSEPVHVNRALRAAGLVEVREELGRELLDAGASPAFALADHQVAHVYVNQPSALPAARQAVSELPGVDRVLGSDELDALRLRHPRSGDLVALARPDAWFTYYYWLDERRAPDFARTVDIHRKPGYDPAELFLDRGAGTLFRMARALARKALGFRYLMDVIGTDASRVRGSHGVPATDAPLLLGPLEGVQAMEPTEVCRAVLRAVFGQTPSDRPAPG